MIKLKLKRRQSGKAIKKAKREAERYLVHTYVNPDTGETFKRKYLRHHPDQRKYWKNKPVGRKSKITLYDLEEMSVGSAHTNEYAFKEYLKMCKNSNQIQRLYKAFPYFHPDAVKKREHENRVKLWQQKLKANELIQLQNKRN